MKTRTFLTVAAMCVAVCGLRAGASETAALQAEIDRVAAAGGGRVVVPSGRHVIGSVYLKDNVELHLAKGAVLVASPSKADYNAWDVCPQNTTNANESSFGAHLILAIERKNVSITGEGTIDGNCEAFLCGPHVVYRQDGIPWRPSQLLYFVECDDVRLTSFTLRHTPYWGCYLFGCRNVEVKGLTVRQRRYPHTHNGDGIDIDTCEHVRVSDCDILASDDALTLRACASRLKRPMECRDVVVRNCRLSSACTAMRLGVGDGTIRDCDIRGLKIWRTRSAFDYVSSWSRRSPGTSFRNITIADVELEAVVFLTMRRNYGTVDPVFDNLVFRNVKGVTEMSSDVYAGEDPRGAFGTVVFDNVDVGQGVEIRGVKNPVITGGNLPRLELDEKRRADNKACYQRRLREYWHLTGEERANPVRVAEIEAALPETPGWPDDHVSNRARWRKKALLADERRQLGAAEKVLAEPIPSCTEEAYRLWLTNKFLRASTIPAEKRYNGTRRARNLAALAVAECVEDKGRFLPKIVDYLEAIVVQPSWAWAPHDKSLGNLTGERYSIELGSSAFVLDVAKALDRLRGRLPQETVARVRAEIEKRAFSVYRASNDGSAERPFWWSGSSNWSAVCHGNTVRAALRLIESRADRAAFVEAAERGMKGYLRSFLDDGFCTEGLSYWNYGFEHYLDLVTAVRRFTDGAVDLAIDPVSRLAMEYPKRYTVDGKMQPFFSDSSEAASAAVLGKGTLVWPDFTPEMPRPLPIRDYLPCAQVLVARPSVADRAEKEMGLFAVFKGGSNGYNHNHNDLGSYGIVLDGEWMAGDPGGIVYMKDSFGPRRYENPLVGSYGHPVPLLGELRQRAGTDAVARLVSTSFADARDELVFDLSAGYAGVAPGSVMRTFVYDRANKSVTVTDRVRLDQPAKLEFPVTTHCKIRETGKGTYVFLSGGKGRGLDVKMSVAGGSWSVKRETLANPRRKDVVRLAAALDVPVREATATVVYTAAMTSGER